jgi:hypothetical protein
MEIYLHSSIRLHGAMINELSTGTTLNFTFTYVSTDANYSDDWPQDISSLKLSNIFDVLAARGLGCYQ